MRRPSHVRLLPICVLSSVLVGCSGDSYRGARSSAPALPVDRPIERIEGEFVSSSKCRACHPREYATWYASYHRSMTQEARPENVVASFQDVDLHFRGRDYRLMHADGELRVEMADPDFEGTGPAPRIQVPFALVTGSHHFQAFWLPTGKTRKLEFFPMCYRIDVGRWMPVDSAFLFPPEDHQELDNGRWNRNCNKCHTTQGRPGLRGPDDMDTTAAEFGISCEACHGPAAEHVAQNASPARRYRAHFSEGRDESIVQPEHLDARRSAQVCGQCHAITSANNKEEAARWRREGYSFRAGDNLLATRNVRREGEEYFWDDGVIRVSGREYNGLTRSPCYEHGLESRGIMTCVSCHQMHPSENDGRTLAEWADDQLKVGMRGNLACLQCHREYEAPERLVEHTRHELSSAGSQCMNCHMTYTSWGLMKAMRTHQVTSPSALESLETGRPNACNQCHLDRSLAWAADHLEERGDQPRPSLDEDQVQVAASILWLLTGDAGQRALMAWSFGWPDAQATSGTTWMAPYLAQLFTDPYDTVRFRAHRSLRTLWGFEDFEYDFVGPPSDRGAALERALERWRNLPAEPGPRGEHLLLNPDGSLQTERFQRLLQQRDDRPVSLQE